MNLEQIARKYGLLVSASSDDMERRSRTGITWNDAVLAAIAEAVADEKANEWKRELIEALVVDCIYRSEHETNPRKALHDLIAWEAQIALDPRVSSDAAKLIARAVAEMQERCAKVCTEVSLEHPGDGPYYDGRHQGAVACAAAIRALETDKRY